MLCFLIRPEIDLKFSTQFLFIGDMVEGDMSRGIYSPRELARNEMESLCWHTNYCGKTATKWIESIIKTIIAKTKNEIP